MSTNDEPETDDARRAREALAALGRAPAADPAFRARLRREFASGAVGGTDAAPPRVLPFPQPRRNVMHVPRWLALPVAAALLAVSALAFNAGAPWRVVRVSGAGSATVDGHAVPLSDAAAMEAALRPGARVRLPDDAQLEVAAGRSMAIQMTGGTDAVVPAVPGRWFGRSVRGTMAAGEWRITTGADFPGSRLEVVTPAAHVEVSGTTLAVICQPQGTCVCVYEGHVLVGRDASDLHTVLAGRRRYTYVAPGKPALDDAMLPVEVPALGSFCETARPLTKRPR